MDRRAFKVSRVRNWLAMLLMIVAAIAAGRTRAAEVVHGDGVTVAAAIR